MKKLCSLTLILAMVAGPIPAGVYAADDDVADDPPQATQPLPDAAWPVKFEAAGAAYVVYPPQLDKWEGNRLEGRAAVAVTPQGAESPEFGIAWLTAQTSTDPSGQVAVREFTVGKVDFPTVSGGSSAYADALRAQLSGKTWNVSQARLESDLEIDKATRKAAAEPVKNDVPQILFSQAPAILVPIDGTPVLRDIPDTKLKRVVNTRALLVLDPALSRYYLYVADHWVEASKFEGPWTTVTNLPAGLEQARQVAVKDNQVDLLQPEEGEAPPAVAPAIYVSTTPTELLQTDGPANYAPVENTRLLYVTNSPNRIFLDTATQTHYVLISGRWFRARNLGPTAWEYVSASALPGDFARIPSTHSQESVRAAVAGTPQAREAAIENTVPQVATVTRSAASLTVTYDGTPSFVPVEGTSLQRAANAPIPVLRLDANSFYALDNGVWFVATSPFGPWSVASTVPAVVYSIPRSSPIHYVTYVRVYDATPDYVYVGYTPGYVGSYISSDNVVVYGTGWHYRPWIGAVWYSAPLTWGFGFSYVHTWWRPWWRPYRPVFWHPPAPCFRPAWGPWHYRPVARTNVVVNNITVNRVNRVNVQRTNVTNVYNRWDRQAVARNRAVEPGRPQWRDADRGRGVARPDGNRQAVGGDGRRDRNDGPRMRNDVVQGGSANAPAVQMPGRRDNDGRPPFRGNDRADRRDRMEGNPPAVQGQANPNGGPRAERPADRNDLPRIQGQNRRWNRDDDRGARPDGGRPQWRQGDGGGARPPVTAMPRQDNRVAPPQGNVQPRGNPATPPQANVQPQFRNQERREAGRPDGNRWERRDFSSRPQSVPERRAVAPQMQAPRVQAAPQVQAPRMQAAPRPQMRAAPEVRRAEAPPPRQRMERNEGRSARSEHRGGGGGQREFRAGGGFRPEAR